MSGQSAATLHRVGDVTPAEYAVGNGHLLVDVTVNGGTVVLEYLANEAATTESGSWTTAATYNTNQVGVTFNGTAGRMYRLRCTVAPSAGLDLAARFTQEKQ